jgi:hypothetical protein
MINVLDKAINSQLYLDYLFDEDMLNSVLIAIEKAGMLPPRTSLVDCEDPELQVYVENIDVPHWVVLGWDKE